MSIRPETGGMNIRPETGGMNIASPQGKIKTGKASLIGGIAVAIAALALWTVITRELGMDTTVWMIVGLMVSAGIGAWIRIADL